ncbi:MAG: hypothetical protein WA364_22600 [Candidatus Nitrosopolaris sp.]
MAFDIPLHNHMIGFPYFDLKEESQTQMENKKRLHTSIRARGSV